MFASARYGAPWKLDGPFPPERLLTPRLILRCWRANDAVLLAAALEPSRAYVAAWIPPALDESTDLRALAARLTKFAAEFRAGVGWVYGIFDAGESRVLGEIGLMPRIGPGALEMGYWIRVDHAGRGFATEAAEALSAAGLALPAVDRMEIRCDAAHAQSAAIARKLGYELIDTVSGPRPDSGPRSGDTLVFERRLDTSRRPASR